MSLGSFLDVSVVYFTLKFPTLAFNEPFNLASVSRSKTPQVAAKTEFAGKQAQISTPPHSQVLSTNLKAIIQKLKIFENIYIYILINKKT